MIGRRLPIVSARKTMRINGRSILMHVDAMTTPEQPGDYCGPIVGYTGNLPAVFFLKPNARNENVPARARSVQHVCSPPHVFTECADGSLQIRESISNLVRGDTTGASDDGWHGYLDCGHSWRQV